MPLRNKKIKKFFIQDVNPIVNNRNFNNSVILINTGVFQEYTNTNISNLLAYKNNVILIIDKDMLSKVKNKELINIFYTESFDVSIFEKNNKLDNKFRGGFWKNTSKRLFLLYEFLKKYSVKESFHIENDVLLYTDTKNININEEKIYLTMDSNERCIPGIVYIPNHTYLNNLIKNYNFKENDMVNLGNFFNNNKDICDTFPIIKKNNLYDKEDIFNKNYEQFKGIFDGAAIGQFLGGVDPRNIQGDTTGFINETCVIDYSKYKIIWEKNEPYIVIDDISIKIFNLHIHCKNLEKFINI